MDMWYYVIGFLIFNINVFSFGFELNFCRTLPNF
jgi:hypothetical protein